jgi:hypothetical protein
MVVLLAGGCYDVDGLSKGFPGGGGDGGEPGDLATQNGWKVISTPGTDNLRGVWAGASDAFAIAANSRIVHVTNDLATMDPAPPGFNLRAIAGVSAPFAVGDSGAVLTRDTNGWSSVSLGDATLYGVWAASDSDVWVVGSGSMVAHDSAGTWTALPMDPLVVEWHAVWSRASDVYVAGTGGSLQHGVVAGDGSVTWSSIALGTSVDLNGLHGTDTELFAVGAGGTILRSGDGGATFAPEGSGTSADLYAVSSSGADVWAAGDQGLILHRTGSSWTIEHRGGSTLRAIWADDAGDAWAAGDDGTLLHLQR